MKKIRNKIPGVFYGLLEALIGILLLINPIGFTASIIAAIGGVLCAVGLWTVIRYFRTPVEEASAQQLLTKGLLMIALGLFAILGNQWIIAVFPLITVIYGVILLVTGIAKIQFVMDAIRKRQRRWFLGIFSVVISLICACVVLFNPFTTTAALWMFTGICIIADALMDIVAVILVSPQIEEIAE